MIATPSASAPRPPALKRSVVLVTQIGLSLVAAFWFWFAAMHLFGNDEGARKDSFIPVTIVTMSLALITASSWIVPRLGGVLAIIGACAAAYFFRGVWGELAVALPIGVAGLLLVFFSGNRASPQPSR